MKRNKTCLQNLQIIKQTAQRLLPPCKRNELTIAQKMEIIGKLWKA
jgi:hypothetical protein